MHLTIQHASYQRRSILSLSKACDIFLSMIAYAMTLIIGTLFFFAVGYFAYNFGQCLAYNFFPRWSNFLKPVQFLSKLCILLIEKNLLMY